jgi:hypothetical protein
MDYGGSIFWWNLFLGGGGAGWGEGLVCVCANGTWVKVAKIL